jgi:hypothetical protein
VKGLGNCHFWDHLPVKIYDRSWKVQNVANLLELFFQLPLAHDLDHLRALIIAITPNGHLVGPSSGGTLETAVNLVLSASQRALQTLTILSFPSKQPDAFLSFYIGFNRLTASFPTRRSSHFGISSNNALAAPKTVQ